ncbi:hypothetical protein EJ110_NYTH60149 [Nymphaea thermarum]|nr:hypothetical protein EJ110_NYTH60149 [Nymphaea thermarum]
MEEMRKERQSDMDEFQNMFRLLTSNQQQGVERATQGPNKGRDKGKGLLINPNYQTDTELDPYVSQAGTSTQDVRRDMGPPPDRHPQGTYGDRIPRGPRFTNTSQNRNYYDSEGEQDEEVIITRRRKSRAEKGEKRGEKRNEKREEKEEAPPKEENPPEAESLHSMQDPNKLDSFKVFGRINGKKVLILLDNGATRNFLTEEAARRCNVPLETSRPQTIIVGGGGRLQCLSKGKDLEVVIKKMTFKVDFLVIALDGVDLILDPVQAERPEPSRRKRKASEMWARTLQCVAEDLPEEVNKAPKPVVEGGEDGAAKAEEVLGQVKSQGGQDPNAGLTELTRLEPSVSPNSSTPRARQGQGLEERLSQVDSTLYLSPK